MTTFMEKIAGFTVAYARWVAAGCPRRSPAWVKEIFETHCEPCEWYDPNGKTIFLDVGVCTKCKCHVSPDATKQVNKIAWPDTSCPLDPPKWSANVEGET